MTFFTLFYFILFIFSFTNISTGNYTSIQWSVDGISLGGANSVSHIFTTIGDHNITLVVNYSIGGVTCTYSFTQRIAVKRGYDMVVPNAFTPSKLFTNFYDKEYTYQYAGVQTVAGKKVDVILLMPTSKSKQYTKVELMIDQANSVVAGGKMYEKNGNVYAYTVSGYTPNPVLADNLFVFDAKKYPKVEVVDLR